MSDGLVKMDHFRDLGNSADKCGQRGEARLAGGAGKTECPFAEYEYYLAIVNIVLVLYWASNERILRTEKAVCVAQKRHGMLAQHSSDAGQGRKARMERN